MVFYRSTATVWTCSSLVQVYRHQEWKYDIWNNPVESCATKCWGNTALYKKPQVWFAVQTAFTASPKYHSLKGKYNLKTH